MKHLNKWNFIWSSKVFGCLINLQMCKSICVLLLLIFTGTCLAQTPVGSTTQQTPLERSLADSSVSLQNGAMSSRIAIATPEFHQLTPKLTLAYSSSAGNGFAGMGWDVQGFSTIERASPNRGSPRYKQTWTNDSYILDGEQLIPSTSLGGTYTTKRQSFLRITGNGSGTTNNWTVTDKEGTVSTYSPIYTVGTSTFRWGLTKVQDTHGNVVNYSWQCDKSTNPVLTYDCYPATVTYGSTVITLYKETRTDQETFANGYNVGRTNFRLKSIGITHAGSLLRAYNLVYQTSTRTQRSLLNTVQHFGSDASINTSGVITGGTTLPKTTFAWSDTANGFLNAELVSGKYGLPLSVWQVAQLYTDDFNGDGRADFLLIYAPHLQADTKVYLLLANATGSFNNAVDITTQSGMTPQNWYYSRTQITTGDFDGDGRADLLLQYSLSTTHKIFRLLANTTGGFSTAVDIINLYGMTTAKWSYAALTMADFNGDGKSDLLVTKSVGGGSYLANMLTASTGGAFNTALDVTNLYGMNGSKWYTSALSQGDFNGDGKTDLIMRYTYSLSQYVYLLVANQTNGFETVTDISNKYGLTASAWFGADLYPNDFNGDGRTDIFIHRHSGISYPHYLLYANGSDGTNSAGNIEFDNALDVTNLWGMNLNLWSAALLVTSDFNGDHRADIFVRSTRTINQDPMLMLYSNGPGFQNAKDVTNLYGMTADTWAYADYRVGDYDGNGEQDLFVHAYNGLSPALEHKMLYGNSATTNLLTSITNGYGGTTAATYKTSPNWVNTNNPPLTQTVSTISTSDGRGWSAATNYSYSGGAWDPIERRHLGFRYVKAIDPTGAYEESFYYQGEAFQLGELEEQYKKNVSGGTMSRQYRTLTGSASAPWVRNLTLLDEYECNGDATCKQSQKSFAYDAYGNTTRMTDHGEVDTVLTGDERTTTYTYNFNTSNYIVSLPSVITVTQGTTGTGTQLKQNRKYYDNGLLTAAPLKGDVTRTEDWLNTTSNYVASTATYDTFGNVLTSTDQVGNVTTTGWDSAGLFPLSIKNALNQTQSTTWNAGCGVQLSATDLNSKVTSWTYDSLCRRTKETRPDGGWTDTAYVGYGNPTTQYNRTTINNGVASSRWTSKYFDGMFREWQSVNNVSETTETIYDNRGLIGSVSAPYAPAETKKFTLFSYDALRRLTLTTQPDNSTRQMLYGDWNETSCDELNKPRTRYRDAYGQVRKVREFIGPACAVAPVCTIGTTCFDTNITYDLLGQQTGIVDALNNTSSSTYDSLGRRTAMTDPDMGAWSYSYDAAGRMLSQTDAKSNQLQFVYDAVNRVTQKKLSTGTVLADYYYDEAGHGAGIGKRSRMIDPSGNAFYTYDVMGQVLSEQKTVGTTTYTTARTYDLESRPITVTYPNSEVVTYSYDAAGRPLTASGYVSAATYDARGHILTRTLGNAVVESISYDPNRFWMLGVNASKSATTLNNVTLTYNTRGEVLTRVNAISSAKDNWNYAYDDLRRLTTATNITNVAYTQAYTFDAIGRMTTQTGMGTYIYPSTGSAPRHAPTSIGGNAHVYDLNGNLTSGSGNTIAYDVENRPLTANGISMVYDGDGIRVKLGITVYISNLYEIDTSTGTATNYIFFGDSQIARKRSGAVHYYHGDKLGSVNAISDSTGLVVLRKTYAPYGNIVLQTGTFTDSFGLAGQRLDPTGLYHMGAREMAPNMGLFVTPDPSNAANPEKPQTLNRYAYAMNTPTNLFDPTGYAAEDPETTYDKWSFWTHNALSVAGSIPVLGAIPDAVDLVYTGIEVPFGKSSGTDLGLAAAGLGSSFLPFVDQGVGVAKVTARAAERSANILLENGSKNASDVIDAATSTTTIAKKSPNPWGSRGGPDHVATINKRIQELKDQGYRHANGGSLKEEVLVIPNGNKSMRRPDITMEAPGGNLYRENVGRATKAGNPVARERSALDDIENVTGVRPGYTSYSTKKP